MRPFLTFLGLIVAAIVIVAVVASIHPGSSSTTTSEQYAKAYPQASAPKPSAKQSVMDFDKAKAGAIQATLEIEGRGTMTLELYPQAAPKTVAHFVELCNQHYYEGILFHRAEPNFVIQSGDPASKKIDPAKLRGLTNQEVTDKYQLGTGGSGKTVPLEAHLPHDIYSVGLARATPPDSGDSQFYINLKDNHNIDGLYCIFGRVIHGQEVAQTVQIGDRIKRLSVP